MPPPKARLHKTTGKLKAIPKSAPTIASRAAANASSDDTVAQSSPSESDRQFELELYWCIQQLENSLNAPHIRENNKKVEDTMKVINVLKSANQPLIKKRQIMRTTFGDYRSKMAEEEKTMALNPESVRFDPPKKKAKYHFVKKAAILNEENRDFRFNFANIQLDDEEKGQQLPDESIVRCRKDVKPGTVVPSDNSFRFNFTIDN